MVLPVDSCCPLFYYLARRAIGDLRQSIRHQGRIRTCTEICFLYEKTSLQPSPPACETRKALVFVRRFCDRDRDNSFSTQHLSIGPVTPTPIAASGYLQPKVLRTPTVAVNPHYFISHQRRIFGGSVFLLKKVS